MKHKPQAIILSGFGLNCEDETQVAFRLAGGDADVVHINDLVNREVSLSKYKALIVPGGFSYGDHTGSGKAYANKLKNHLEAELHKFVSLDKLVLGVCNGFQILTQFGFLPGALTNNESARYLDRWVDLKITQESSIWLKGIQTISLPVAHGEGRYITSPTSIQLLKKNFGIGASYFKGDICNWQDLPANPNGAMDNIAAVSNYKGRVLGIMPHPERAMFFTQLPNWTYLKEEYKRAGREVPEYGPGLLIFKNAVKYFE